MTNEEIIAYQRAAKAHREALPLVMADLNALMRYAATGESVPDAQLLEVTAGQVRTLLREIERAQAQVRQLNADLRDEAREAQRSAGDAYTEGRHAGIEETRGY